ncbi:hypothetical protein IPL68_00640 [Candidatus Saccharibacteria bacterium]|nr:MAG: hypothetical protein IPL68_00640 [Candidatus Saccharibacteria bacterium]
MNVGRCYARACIITTQAGLATSVLAASAIDAETRHNLARYFHLSDRPIMVIRIGKPTIPARHGPRWPLEEVMTSQAEA